MFEYAGQDVATVHISVNDGEPIENKIIYCTIKGVKIDRETGENIAVSYTHLDEQCMCRKANPLFPQSRTRHI